MIAVRSWQIGFRGKVALASVAIAVVGVAVRAGDEPAPKLRYDWKAGAVYSYEVTITADRPDVEDKLSGVITFTAKSVGNEQLDVVYSGGLGRKETPKPGAQSSSGPGPRRPGGGPPRPTGGPRGFFGTTTMTGLTNQTNELKMSKTGDFLSLKGTSQLPYLLGNLSLLPFENLPAEPKAAWEQSSGASITESGDRSRIPGPPSFRNEEDKDKKTTAGGEKVNYAIEGREGSKVIIKRTSELTTAATEGKAPKFTLRFDGKIEFDAERGVTTSYDSKGKLTFQSDNVSVDVPMTVKMRLLTEDERKQIEQKRQELFANAKKQQEEAAAKLKQPLTDDERKEIIKKLEGSNIAFVMQTLQGLAQREPASEDKAIALAIKPHLESKFPGIRGVAEGTWKTWSKLVDDKESAKKDADKADKDKPKAEAPGNPNRPARPARPARPGPGK